MPEVPLPLLVCLVVEPMCGECVFLAALDDVGVVWSASDLSCDWSGLSCAGRPSEKEAKSRDQRTSAKIGVAKAPGVPLTGAGYAASCFA